MKLAESVIFGGSGLDRAAHLRSDAGVMQTLRAEGRVLALWRGKPLVEEDALVWLGSGHPVIGTAATSVFLGMDAGAACFAADVSAWEPDTETGDGGFFDATVQRHPDLPPTTGFAELRGLMTRLSPREAELAATAKAILTWHATHGFCAACGEASVATMAGWQRDCPACRSHHFPRTDPVVIMLVTRGNSVLLGRNENWPEGMFSLLAGFIEPGETIEAAVRREVQEEAGILCGPVRYLASQPWPFPASLMLGAQTEAQTEAITIDPAELQEALWVTREEMVEVMAGLHPRIKPTRKGAIAHFLLQHWLADQLD